MGKADAKKGRADRPPSDSKMNSPGRSEKGHVTKEKKAFEKSQPKQHQGQRGSDPKRTFPKGNQHDRKRGQKSTTSHPKKSATSGATTHEPPAKRPRRHAETVDETKRIWNDLRKKTNTSDDTRRMVDQLMPKIVGKAAQLALQHDASRVVQAAIQFGTPEQRKSILEELCQNQEATSTSSSSTAAGGSVLVELCKSQYGHFVVLKALKYCYNDRDCADRIVKALKSHVSKLATHGVASRVVEHLFQKLPHRQTSVLKQEMYGPHFALFASDTVREQTSAVPTLASNVRAAPDKEHATVEYVRNLVNKGIEKQLFGYAYFQDLLDEFFQVAPPEEVRALAGTPAADASIHMLSTRPGTRVVASLVAYGSAKDRKRIMKSLKGRIRSGLLHRDAYLAILRLVQLTDDTVSIQKGILQEVLTPAPSSSKSAAETNSASTATPTSSEKTAAPATVATSPLLEFALSETASKLFLMLLADRDETRHKFFDPYEHSVLFADPRVVENGASVPTSRKDPDVRRRELLQHLRGPLIELCRMHPEELMRSPSGGRVLVQVYSAFAKGDNKDDDASIALVNALVDTCMSSLTAPSDDKGDDDNPVQLLEDRVGHLTIKNLILADASAPSGDGDNDDSSFAAVFFRRVVAAENIDGGLLAVASSNRGAFVAAAICKVAGIRSAALEQVRLHRTQLERIAASKGGGATAGYAALLNELDGGGTE